MKRKRISACANGALGSMLLIALLIAAGPVARAGVIFGANGLAGGFRWDAAPRTISGRERSLDGGLRFSVSGGSYQAFRDSFSWNVLPSVASFQQAVEDAFSAWAAVDPATGLTSDLRFVADFSTPVVGVAGFGGVNIAGAEIDIIAKNAGDGGTRGFTNFSALFANVKLTSGALNYPGGGPISGADISLNNNPAAVYSLNFFRRLLTHEIGHAIGLGDVEGDINPNRFIDDNYDGSTSLTARTTLNNSWALLVNAQNPAASPLGVYNVPAGNPGVGAAGVDILMESRGLGIAAGNPVTNLIPLRNDDFGMRQFLYPSLVRVPEPPARLILALTAALALVATSPRGLVPRHARLDHDCPPVDAAG
jgi:hypothetical protein